MQDLGGQVPPSSLEAERSVLGSMMMDAQAVLLAAELLRADDFYSQAHSEIFTTMCLLHATRRPVDLVTLAEELMRRGSMDGVGGIAYLSDLSGYVPSTANVASYINIVSEKSTLRKLLAAGRNIAQRSAEARDEVPVVLEFAEKSIFDISMKRGGTRLEALEPALTAAYSHMEELERNKGSIMGVPTGFVDLDNTTTGFHAGELIVIAARPAMGKSALAMNIATNAAVRAGKTVAVFSLEMPREQLANRMMCGEARVDLQAVRQGKLTDSDWEKLAFAMATLAPAPIYLDETGGINVLEIRSKCRRLQVEHGLDMIIIDYLQLMSAANPSASRQNEVAEISKSLKALALELKVPVVALSQLSRAPQGRADHRPMLSDLRDSGAIEQDADLVMFIYRDDYYNTDSAEKGTAEIIISKQRNGPLGTAKLAYLPHYTLFADLPKNY